MTDKRLSEMAKQYHAGYPNWQRLALLLIQVRDEERTRCEGIVGAVRMERRDCDPTECLDCRGAIEGCQEILRRIRGEA
jgi:hypothetical protein